MVGMAAVLSHFRPGCGKAIGKPRLQRMTAAITETGKGGTRIVTNPTNRYE
jgi:hypothetical protein